MPDDRTIDPGEQAAAGDPLAVFFTFFNEVGILNQLATALFNSRLPEGVTVAHFSVLNHLIRVADGQTPLALASAFQVPKTTMTHTMAGLEARGLVEIRRNPKDGRSKQVWLTEKGRRFRDDAIGLLAGDVAALAPQIDVAAVRSATPILAEVRVALDRARDG